MATVKLSKFECSRGLLPNVCAVCGAPADTRKHKTFAWYTPLAYLGLLGGLLPFVIIALVLTKRMSVGVPFCHQHQGHWGKRNALVLLCLLAVLLVGVGAMVYTSGQPPGAKDNLSPVLCIGSFVLLVAWLILSIVVQLTSIRTTEITDRTITLTRIHADFVAALEEDREKDRDDRDRRGRYGDIRDDYDDEYERPPPRRRARDDDHDDDYDDRPRRRHRDDR